MTARHAVAAFPALGTTAHVAVTDASGLPAACRAVREHVEALDRACSRFRPDSELTLVNRAGGRPVRVGPLLLRALREALAAASLTGGIVDPTVGAAMEAVGYDRDFASLPDEGGGPVLGVPVPGWRTVRLDLELRTVRVPRGVRLDLGATAKALGADLAAARANSAAGCGVLVSLGGDVGTAGSPPSGGWPVRVADDHRDGPDRPGQTITVRSGGLATSSVTVRRWRRGGRTLHHILEPTSGLPAEAIWRTVSVAASSCLQANTASTAAVIMGERAPAWLGSLGLPARLVAPDGRVVLVAGWPQEEPCSV